MILATIGQKGGTGKTTVCVNVAAELMRRGRAVCVIDADPQGSARTWGDVATEAGRPAPTIVAMGAGLHRPDQAPALAKRFDVTVIDCPPRHGEVQRAALAVVDLALIPCGPGPADLWALAETLELVAKAQEMRPELKAAIVVTRRRRTALGANARPALEESGLPVLEAELGLRSGYEEALAAGQGVTAYAGASVAADEVRALVDEIEALVGQGGKRGRKA